MPLHSHAADECNARDLDFASTFRGQYLISATDAAAPDSWHVNTLAGWTVASGPSVPVCTVLSASGEPMAQVLGIAVSPSDGLLQKTHTLPTPSQLHEFIATLSGRFNVLAHIDGQVRIYPDPVGNFGPVYDPETGRIAASVNLCLNRAPIPHQGLSDAALEDHAYFFGLTPDAKTRRLTPNHYLNLSDFTETRFWPNKDTNLADPGDLATTAKAMNERLAFNIAEIVKGYQTALTMSGGKDSRIMMANALSVLGDFDEIYAYKSNFNTGFDLDISNELAQKIGFDLTEIDVFSDEQLARYTRPELRLWRRTAALLNGGFWNGGDRQSAIAHLLSPATPVTLRGNVIDMTRANRWSRAALQRPSDTALGLQAIQHPDWNTPSYAQTFQLYEKWRASHAKAHLPRTIDLAFTELLLPVRQGTVYLGIKESYFVNPFNDRYLIEHAMQVDPVARRNDQLVDAMIADAAPELAEVEFTIDRKRRYRAEKEKGPTP